MANIVRFEPMREMMTLRDAMDQLFNESFTRTLGPGRDLAVPELDMYQDNNNIVVKAALPGLKAEQVTINVSGDMLTLRGEYAQEEEKKERTYHLRERRSGSFERTIRLPAEVASEKAAAEFENGILTVTLPKSESVKPRSIAIKMK